MIRIVPTIRQVCPSFNGAAFFQSGKFVLDRHVVAHNHIASMEPLFFKAENKYCVKKCDRLIWLQWSRFFSKRKMSRFARRPLRRRSGFNGAAFFQSGKSISDASGSTSSFLLQWSRFFSKRKICTKKIKHNGRRA